MMLDGLTLAIKEYEGKNTVGCTDVTYPKSSSTNNPHKYSYGQKEATHQLITGEYVRELEMRCWPLSLEAGQYILHIKPTETTKSKQIALKIGVGYQGEDKVTLEEVFLKKNEKSLMLRSAFLSSVKPIDRHYILKGNRDNWVHFGDTFESMGYGSVCIGSEPNATHAVYLEFHP